MNKSKKIKILFLDIDGVLNVYPQGHDEYGSLFHPNFQDNLKRIIDETGAKIVISSSWRYSGLEVMQEMWAKRNIPGEVIDVTTFTWEPGDDTLSFKDRAERGHEIQEWIDSHDIENYVILDDDNDMLKSQLDHFIQTSGNRDHIDAVDGVGYGLTIKCAEKAINILNNKLLLLK